MGTATDVFTVRGTVFRNRAVQVWSRLQGIPQEKRDFFFLGLRYAVRRRFAMNKTEPKGLVVCMVEHMTEEQTRVAADATTAPLEESCQAEEKRRIPRFVEDPLTGYSHRGVYLN